MIGSVIAVIRCRHICPKKTDVRKFRRSNGLVRKNEITTVSMSPNTVTEWESYVLKSLHQFCAI